MSGVPGRSNDASILARSALTEVMDDPNNKTDYHIIADAAFPLRTWLMKPFEIKNNMPILEKNFNYRLSNARMTIENSFRRLKARWRILLRKPDVHIDTMRDIIHGCLLLHNFCEQRKEKVYDRWVRAVEDEERILEQVTPVGNPGRSNYHDDHENELTPTASKRGLKSLLNYCQIICQLTFQFEHHVDNFTYLRANHAIRKNMNNFIMLMFTLNLLLKIHLLITVNISVK